MSARALLLSPDDQAVSAITGVLEELSVLCERPRDGATAAQKLNSQTYDLVLVDCDNLPAAKLIFDVCRRSHAGTTIPIAIVDGRAGLPTAFRLGAELILTKPVAKDQARTTIRTAVSRVRKEDPARAHAMDFPAMDTPAASIPEPRAQAAAAGAVSSPAAPAAAPQAEIAHASEVAPPSAFSVTEEPKAAPAPAQIAPPTIPAVPTAEPETQNEKPALVSKPVEKPAVKTLSLPKEEVVREQLTKAETELETPITFSSFDQSKKRPKGRGGLVALVLLGMVGAGFYAAWTLQPDFRAMVKPQIDKALDIADNLTGQKKAAPVQPAQPVAKAPAPQTPAPTPSAPVPVADATPAPDKTSQSASDSTSAATETPATATPEPTAAKADSTDGAEKSPEKPAKAVAGSATPAESELPWEKDTVILSSKGAEKRLVHHVQPAFPKGSRAQKADGTVVLKTLVGGNGSVQGVRLVEGNPAFATAATKAVKQWRYKPYIRDGSRTPFQTIVIVDFQQP